MPTKSMVDPELLPGLDLFPTLQLSEELLPVINQQIEAMIAARPQEETEADIAEHSFTSSDGEDLIVVVHTPRAPADGLRPAVLHIHGGGYVMGSARAMTQGAQQITVGADCVVVSVDYRLAPQTRHPGPVNDCYDGLRWLFANAAMLGIDTARVAIAGESAGGGLAAATALMARDRAEFPLVHQHLIYPMLDDRTAAREPHPFTGQFIWTAESNRFGWRCLLGEEPGGANISAYAAAARADDLSNLPPTFIYVGALDLFVEEDMEYARRLIRAGVPTELHVFAGAFHGFEVAVEADVTRRAKDASLSALRRALHPAAS